MRRSTIRGSPQLHYYAAIEGVGDKLARQIEARWPLPFDFWQLARKARGKPQKWLKKHMLTKYKAVMEKVRKDFYKMED